MPHVGFGAICGAFIRKATGLHPCLAAMQSRYPYMRIVSTGSRRYVPCSAIMPPSYSVCPWHTLAGVAEMI